MLQSNVYPDDDDDDQPEKGEQGDDDDDDQPEGGEQGDDEDDQGPGRGVGSQLQPSHPNPGHRSLLSHTFPHHPFSLINTKTLPLIDQHENIATTF